MAISIQKKLITMSLVITLVTMVGISALYYAFIKQEKQRLFRKQVQIAFSFIWDDIEKQQVDFKQQIKDFLSEDETLSWTTFAYHMNKEEIYSASFILTYLSKSARKLRNFGRAISATRLALYTEDRRLLAIYQRNSKSDTLGLHLISSSGMDTYLSMEQPNEMFNLLMQEGTIPTIALPDGFNPIYDSNVPAQIDSNLFSKEGKLGIRVMAPIYREGQRTGFLVGEVTFTQNLVENYALLSQTVVNFYVGNNLSIGTLVDQSKLPDELVSTMIPCTKALNDQSQKSYSLITSDDNAYELASCALEGDGKVIGAMVIGFSRDAEKKEIEKGLMTVLLIAVSAFSFASALTILFSRSVSKPLKNVVQIIRTIANGDLLKIDNDVSLKISKDKVGFRRYLDTSLWQTGEIEVLQMSVLSMSNYLQRMAESAEKIARGEIHRPTLPRSQRDVLGNSFHNMAQYLQTLSISATAIASGNLQHEIKPVSPEDVLGNAFYTMTLRLRLSFDELQQEIKERQETEKALRASEHQYRQLLENIPQKIFYKDMASVYITCNDNFARDFNLSSSEIAGKTDFDFFPKELAQKYRDDDGRIIQSKIPEDIIEKYIHHGAEFTVRTIKSPVFNDNGHVSGILGIFWDITENILLEKEREKLENQLIRSQKLEAIGVLAGGIAHDFNNILSPILGYAEMLEEDLSEAGPQSEQIQEIMIAAKRAKDLVAQILAFSRQSEDEPQTLEIQMIVKEVLQLCRSTLPSTISINSQINNACDPVNADPTKIHQITMNLITNAFHAMEADGGILSVTVDEVLVGPFDLTSQTIKPGKYVCLAIEDTGCGIKQNIINKIFDPYFTTKVKNKGTGLGLSVVHGIIKGCGGDITVYSEEGKGSVFKVYLPCITAFEKKIEESASKIDIKGTGTILLVDDERMIIEMEQKMLERLGYRVVAMTSSQAALKTFEKDPNVFKLVITDMTMPEMTGDQLALKIKSIRPDVPVILCTGFSEKITEKKARALGIDAFLMKPMLKTDLSKAISRSLARIG
ncbi:MAG: response regulator [Desulfobacteraceae bacterium]|jgi:PAS domain S-box-containing protein